MPPATFSELVDVFLDLIRVALPVVAGLAFLIFLWGLIKFIFRLGGKEDAVKEGRQLIVWGLFALFILVSFWALIGFVFRDLGFVWPFGSPLLPE